MYLFHVAQAEAATAKPKPQLRHLNRDPALTSSLFSCSAHSSRQKKRWRLSDGEAKNDDAVLDAEWHANGGKKAQLFCLKICLVAENSSSNVARGQLPCYCSQLSLVMNEKNAACSKHYGSHAADLSNCSRRKGMPENTCIFFGEIYSGSSFGMRFAVPLTRCSRR